jgi:hypothetical protein
MEFIFLISLTTFIIFIVLFLISNKIFKLTILNFIIIVLFYFSVMVVYFYIGIFNADVTKLLFPDENLYVHGTYEKSLFGQLIKNSIDLVGFSVTRAWNLTLYLVPVCLLFNEVIKSDFKQNKSKTFYVTSITLLIGLSVMGSYWSFFLLKEALTMGSLSLIFLGQKKNSKFIMLLGAILLYISRPHYLIVFVILLFFKKIYHKSKKVFKFLLILTCLFGVFFLSSQSFLNIMNTYASLRYIDLGVQVSETRQELRAEVRLAFNTLGSVKFLTSDIFFEMIKNNILRAFNPLIQEGIWAKLIVSLNLISLLWIIIFLKPKKNYLTYMFFVTLILLIFTHSNFRYVNTIMVPFTMYFTLINFTLRKKNNIYEYKEGR